MKIKKIILLILTVSILTGCTAQVNLKIDNEKVYEEIIIDDSSSPLSVYREYNPVYYKNSLGAEEPDTKIDGIEYYKREITNINGVNRIKYSYTYSIENYNKSKTMTSNFKSSAITYSSREGFIELYTSNDGIFTFNTYKDLTNLSVNITTDLDVADHNADSVNGNTYTWNYTPSNKNKNIYIQIKNVDYERMHPEEYSNKKNKKKGEDLLVLGKENKDENKQEKLSLILLVIIALGGFIGITIIVNKINIKNNR